MPLTSARVTQEDQVSRLETLFDLHRDRLFRLALRLVGERQEAEDLSQEAFLRAARVLERVPAEEPGAEAWLVRTLVNLCRDRHRRHAVRRRHAERELREASPGPDPTERTVAHAAVEHALGKLEPRRRAIVVMRYLEGLSAVEIARLLSMRAATVRWHLMAARRQMEEILR